MSNSADTMKIDIDLLLLLSEPYRSIPLRTPDRYMLIHQFAIDIWKSSFSNDNRCNKEVILDVTNEDFFSPTNNFSLTVENIIRYEQDIPTAITHTTEFNSKYPKIFLPSQFFCCNKMLKIIPYFASVILYTSSGSDLMQRCATRLL